MTGSDGRKIPKSPDDDTRITIRVREVGVIVS